MAFKRINRKWEDQLCCFVEEYVCDSEDDVKNLPECATGSIAMVTIEGMPMYMVNASGEWVKVC